jgi:triosephosphate isomerase
MNLDLASSVELAKGLVEKTKDISDIDMAVCPPSVYLRPVAEVISGTTIGLGAQNAYHEPKGAFTGEISMAMVKDVGCQYVILGHSERRHVMGESSEDVNVKVLAALEEGLTPIVCLGEQLSEREAGVTELVVRRQFEGSLSGVTLDQMKQCVIAYEPVWAIGTGKVATPEQAEEVHLALRKIMEERYNKDIAEAVRIQYGGSVKPENAKELLSQPNIDGALVGGASLKVDSFCGIIENAK